MERIPVNEPDLGGNELAYVTEAVKTGWISSTGKYVTEFERRFAEFVGTEFAVSTTSGTCALQLAVESLGIGPGDEVIVPALTIAATVFAICYRGATPVLIDSELETANLDVSQLAGKVTPRTRAILPVHLYGHPADMDPIMTLARERDIPVIEDAAEAHGATYKGVRAGSIGDINCFSFYANKIVTTGEGGMITTNNPRLADYVRRIKDLAHSPERRFVHTDVAYTLRMTNLQAALGVAQMERVDEFLARKRGMAEAYGEALTGIDGLILPVEKPWACSVYWMYAIRITPDFGCGRDEFMARLREKGIETRTFFVPMHRQPCFHKLGLFHGEEYPVADQLSEEGLYLPSGLTLTRENIGRIADAVRDVQREVRH